MTMKMEPTSVHPTLYESSVLPRGDIDDSVVAYAREKMLHAARAAPRRIPVRPAEAHARAAPIRRATGDPRGDARLDERAVPRPRRGRRGSRRLVRARPRGEPR